MLKCITEQRCGLTEKVNPPEIIQNFLNKSRLIFNKLSIVKRAALKYIILERPQTKTVNGINGSRIKITERSFKNLLNVCNPWRLRLLERPSPVDGPLAQQGQWFSAAAWPALGLPAPVRRLLEAGQG